MSETCNYCAVEPCRCRPSRLERVAEALFVQAMAEWTKGVPSWQTSVKDVAATAIRQAVAFDKVWELRES